MLPHLLTPAAHDGGSSMGSSIDAREPMGQQNNGQQKLPNKNNTTNANSSSSALRINYSLKSLRGGGGLPPHLKIKKESWWRRRPILDGDQVNYQKFSLLAPVFSVLIALLQIGQSLFEFLALGLAHPGAHYRFTSPVSMLFVYSGNQIVRFSLMATSALLLTSALYLFGASIQLSRALQKEYELLIKPWLRAMALFAGLRLLALAFQSTVNDLLFPYHQLNLLFWSLTVLLPCTFFWLVVLANYQELCDITRLEDNVTARIRTLGSIASLRSFQGLSPTANLFSSNFQSSSYASLQLDSSSLEEGEDNRHHHLLSRPPPFHFHSKVGLNNKNSASNSSLKNLWAAASSSPALNQSFLNLWSERMNAAASASSRKEKDHGGVTDLGSRYHLDNSRPLSSLSSRVLSDSTKGSTGTVNNTTPAADYSHVLTLKTSIV